MCIYMYARMSVCMYMTAYMHASAVADPVGEVRPWLPSSLAIDLVPLRRRNEREILGNILCWLPVECIYIDVDISRMSIAILGGNCHFMGNIFILFYGE